MGDLPQWEDVPQRKAERLLQWEDVPQWKAERSYAENSQETQLPTIDSVINNTHDNKSCTVTANERNGSNNNESESSSFLQKWIQGDYTPHPPSNEIQYQGPDVPHLSSNVQKCLLATLISKNIGNDTPRNVKSALTNKMWKKSIEEDIGQPRNLPSNIQVPESPLREDEPNRHSHLVEQDQLGFLAVLADDPFPDGIPRNVKETLNDNTWRKSMKEEFDAHVRNGTWELVERQSRMHVIGSTWTYRTKREQKGHPLRYKSRLCAQGFRQLQGMDYDETYSPVVGINTIRLMLSFAASRSQTIYQADVPTAYLNASVDKEIYMKQPTGFAAHKKGGGELACLL